MLISRSHRSAAALAMTAVLCGACGRNEASQPPPAASAHPGGRAVPAARPPPPPAVPLASLPKIEAAPILDTITKMSSDKFQGRAPGTVGEDITVGYLEMRFKELGLQ